MYTSSPSSHNQTAKYSDFRKQFQIYAFRVRLKKALRAVKETSEGCKKTSLNATNFHRFNVHSFKFFPLNLMSRLTLIL